MRIEDFPRPKDDSRRGIHWSASVYHPVGSALDFWVAELQAMKIKWVKVLDDGGGSSLEVSQRLLAANIMPIVRIYRLEPNPGSLNGREQDTVRRLVAAGVRYMETNNEPDLSAEWKGGQMPGNWLDVVADNFIVDADIVLAAGGLPALPAMAVGSKANLLELVVKRGRADLFQKGAWIAIHNYTLNHPLDYPYDPVNQEGQAVSQAEYDALGPWAWEGVPRDTINQWRASDKNPGATIVEDASCFLLFQAVDKLARQSLGFSVPIISTEGGPVVGWKEDRRYPRITPNLHSERVVAIAEYMQGTREIHGERCPSNYFAICHWLISNYRIGFMAPGWESQAWYTHWWEKDFGLQGALPVVAALKALPGVVVEQTSVAGITGKVRRADNDEPLPNLTVQLLRGDGEVAKTQTGADGAFAFLNLTAGAYDIAIAPWGIVRRGATAVEGGGQPLAIRLSGGRGSVLSGTVQDPAGAAVAGVEITVQRDGQLLGRTTSAANGAFRFEGLTLGLYRLSIPGITVDGIALDGWQAKSLKLTTGVAAGYKYILDKKRLLPPEETENRRLFYGVIVDALGKPLNGIKVQMSWTGAAPGTNFPIKVTGSDPYKPAGYYEFLHTPGTFTVQVVQGDWPADPANALETANVPGREGQPVTYEVNFRMQAARGPAQIDGVINGGKAGRKMTLTPVSASAGGPPTRQAVLAADGGFAFPSTASGTYQLSLEGTGVISRNIVISSGSLFKVLFALRSRVSGKVLNPTDGLVAVLYAPAPWNWTRQAPLARDGSFAFDNLPAGRYRLQVGGRVFTDLALTGESRLALAPVDLFAGRRSVVRGHIADVKGQPKAGRMVTLKRQAVVVAQMRSAADGTYRFANLPAGTYSVEVAGLGVVTKSVALDGEREAVADVVWPGNGPRGVLQGRIMTESGAPRPFTLVRLVQDESELARTETDANGDFRFGGLAGGTYEIAFCDDEPAVRGVMVGEDATVVRDVTAAGGPEKFMAHYFLLSPPPPSCELGRDEARAVLALLAHYLTGDVAAGFNLEEAKAARRVTIIGDRVPASAETALAAAGCEVTRLGGDAYAIAGAFAHVFAEG